jgi:hypothetical protein
MTRFESEGAFGLGACRQGTDGFFEDLASMLIVLELVEAGAGGG